MIITIDIPDVLNRKIEAEKRRTGLSKSRIVRDIIKARFERMKDDRKQGA